MLINLPIVVVFADFDVSYEAISDLTRVLVEKASGFSIYSSALSPK